jgi:hypothetical protein
MGTVTDLQTGVHLSIRELAEETELDRDTVQKRITAANATPSGKRGRFPIWRLRDVLKAVMLSNDDGEMDPDKLEPYKRQAHYKAELDRLKLEQETRELIPRIEVEQEQARILRIVAQTLDTLPDIVERDCGATAAQVQRLERALDECREALFQDLTEETDESVRESA